MIASLTHFEFQSKEVRVIDINGDPWFVLADILLMLNSTTRPADAKAKLQSELGDEVVNDYPIYDALHREQIVIVIDESALTFLVSRSRTEIGKKVNRWIHKEVLPSIRKHGKYELPQNEQRSLVGVEKCKAFNEVLDGIFTGVPIRPELLAGLKLNAAQRIVPELSGELEESRNLLALNTAQEYELLTPTEIGKRLGLSAIKVNQLLIDKGLQEKNENRKSRKESAYLPTGKGLEFSDLTLSTGKGNDSTSYQQLRWYSSVLSQL